MKVGIELARATLSALCERAAGGHEVVITRRGVPVARLVGVEADADVAERMRDLAVDLAPFGCRPTMHPVKVLDYARTAILEGRLSYSARAALDAAGAPTVSPKGAPVSDGWRVQWLADEVARLRAGGER